MINENQLPVAIAGYIKAQNAFDVDALADNFSINAVVHDEGKIYNGRDEIRQWNIETNAKYQTQMKPLEITDDGDQYLVKIEMSGTFPGSPLTAAFSFKIDGNKIASLKVV